MNPRRVLGGLAAAFVATAATAALDTWTAYGGSEPGSGFVAFSLAGNAPGLQFIEDNDTAQFHPELETDLPEALSTMSSGLGYAIASVAWPGQTFGNAGDLAVGGGGAPDQFRVLNDPVRAEARNGDGTVSNTSVPGATMTATVRSTETTAHGVVQAARSATALRFADADSSSVARLTGPTAATVSATSTVHDIALAGGVVKIASMASTATATTDGVAATATSATHVSGMTVAGVPVTINRSGLHAGPGAVPLPEDPSATLQQALDRAGLTIVYSGPSTAKSHGDVDAVAGSVVVIWQPPPGPGQSDNHETITYYLGAATVSAHAALGSAYSPPPDTGGAAVPSAAPVPPARGAPAAPSTPAGVAPARPVTPDEPAPQLAPPQLAPAAVTLPGLGRVGAGWIVLGMFGAGAFGIGVLRRLPTSFASQPLVCPRETVTR